MEIEQVTRENGQKEWFLYLEKEEALKLASDLIQRYQDNTGLSISIHNSFEWFNIFIKRK